LHLLRHVRIVEYGVGLIIADRRCSDILEKLIGRFAGGSDWLRASIGRFLLVGILEEMFHPFPFRVVGLSILRVEPETASIGVMMKRLAFLFKVLASRTVVAIAKALNVVLRDADVHQLGIRLGNRRLVDGRIVAIGSRIWKLLNVSVILLLLTDTETMRSASDTKNGFRIPTTGKNDPHNAASFHHVTLRVRHESLVGTLRIPNKGAQTPSKIEFGPKSARYVIKDSLAKFHELALKPLAVQ
jgi:hypothetical protein